MCAVGSLTTERVTQYVGGKGKENRGPDDQPRGGAQDAQRPKPTWSSSKGGLEVVTGERLEIERLTSRSEEGRWKSTHQGNSLAAYPTASPVLNAGDGETCPQGNAPCPYAARSTAAVSRARSLCPRLSVGVSSGTWATPQPPVRRRLPSRTASSNRRRSSRSHCIASAAS